MACLWTREGANLFCVSLGKKEIALEILSEAIGNTNKNMKRLLWIVIAQWLYFLKCYVNFRHNRTSENCRTAILQGIFLAELCSSDAPRTWAWQCCRDHAGQSKENSLHQSHRDMWEVFSFQMKRQTAEVRLFCICSFLSLAEYFHAKMWAWKYRRYTKMSQKTRTALERLMRH